MTKGKYTKEWLEAKMKAKQESGTSSITDPKFFKEWDWKTSEVIKKTPV
jgi:hypothetical protein